MNAFVQQKSEQSTTAVSAFTTSALTVTAGNTLVATSAMNLSGVTPTITDSRSDTFAPKSISEQPAGGQRVQIDTADGAVGGSTTFTITLASGSAFLSLTVQEYSGVATAAVEDTAVGIGADMAPTPSPLIPPSAGDVYVSAWTHNGINNQAFTAATGWTRRSNLTLTANMPLGSEDLIGSGSQVGSATLGSPSANWNVVAVALRAADVSAPDPNANPAFVISGDRP